MRVRTTVYITLFVLAICLAIALLVFWNVYIIRDYLTIRALHTELHGSDGSVGGAVRWVVLAGGITAGVFVIVALSLFFASVMRGNRFKQQQRDFTNMMTHELRLPLSGIRVFAQTLRQRTLEPEEHDRFADGILSECERLGLLIDQLLKIQQIEQRRLFLHKEMIQAETFVRDVTSRWPRPLKTRIEAEGRLYADRLLLEMVLTNFITNAEKYGRGSTPEVILSRKDNTLCLAVRDAGKPLPQKYARKVFRKFYRAPDLNTRRQPGVGLGLYVVKRIARLHKGEARVTPLFPEGNEFSISLPLID